jgi:NACalpha-BTF3-like transcription factor
MSSPSKGPAEQEGLASGLGPAQSLDIESADGDGRQGDQTVNIANDVDYEVEILAERADISRDQARALIADTGGFAQAARKLGLSGVDDRQNSRGG